MGLRLLSLLARDCPEGNIFLSPSALTLALAAAYFGAHGETQRDLGRVLGLFASGPRPEERLEEWRRSVLDPETEVSMTLAASAWLPSGSTLLPVYAERLRRSLDAEAAVLRRDETSAVDQVNQWAQRSTRGRIPHVLSSIDPGTKLLLVTAVDMHAKWQVAFDPEATHEEPFHLEGGRPVNHPLMAQSGEFPHFRAADVEGAALPYGAGRWRMIVLLPAAGRSLDEWPGRLDAKSWREIQRRFRREQGTVSLPRFQMYEMVERAGPLAEIGLARAFDPAEADFRNLASAEGPSALAQLSQTARIDVDEEGTQASAVTLMVQVVAWPPPRHQPFAMRVDRPFFFAIEDQASRTLLLLGAVRDPRPPSRRPASDPPPFQPAPGIPPGSRRLTSP